LSKREEIKNHIVKMVNHAHEKHWLGVKFRTIARQLGRKAKSAGVELREVLETMDEEGAVHLLYDKEHSMLVVPPKVKEQLVFDYLGELTMGSKNLINNMWERYDLLVQVPEETAVKESFLDGPEKES